MYADKSFQVSVEAATINLHTGEKQVTNNFHYTFSSKEPLKRFILPETYRKSASLLNEHCPSLLLEAEATMFPQWTD